jgi:hypothetical protein
MFSSLKMFNLEKNSFVFFFEWKTLNCLLENLLRITNFGIHLWTSEGPLYSSRGVQNYFFGVCSSKLILNYFEVGSFEVLGQLHINTLPKRC